MSTGFKSKAIISQGSQGTSDLLTQNAMVGKLHEISRRTTLKEVFTYFKGVDKDTGAINFEEFKRISKNIPILRDQDDDMLKETFGKIDVDLSGDLTISEFHSFYANIMLLKKPKLEPYPEKNLGDLKGLPFVRKYLWLTLDTHETALGKIFGPAMFFLIIFSVMSLCLTTVPELDDWPGWKIIDAVTSIIFTMEYLARFLTAGRRWQFLIEPLNIVDFCSFLPFFMELALRLGGIPEANSINYLRVLRIFRLMKVIKISRYMSSYLEIFKETVVLARHSFSMLMSLIIFGTTVLGALMYSVEEEAGTFSSIFEAMYWCVITQTTVGYGDIQVVTDMGRFLACITAYTGIFNLTIMVNVMGSCFDEAYTRFLTKEENKFKQQLGVEVDVDSWDDLAEGQIATNPEDPNWVEISIKLLKKVSLLNYLFSDLEKFTWIWDCDKALLEEMNEAKHLLEKITDFLEGR